MERVVGVVHGSCEEVKARREMRALGFKVGGRGDESRVMNVWRDWSPRVALRWVRVRAFSLKAVDVSARNKNVVDGGLPSEMSSWPLRFSSGRMASDIQSSSLLMYSSSPLSLRSLSEFLKQLSKMSSLWRSSYFGMKSESVHHQGRRAI